MKRISTALVLGLLICAIAASGAAAQKGRAVNPNSQVVKAATDSLHKVYSATQLAQGVYVGSDLCLACHQSMSSYKTTNHASFIRRPLVQYSLVQGKGVIANSLKGAKDDFITGLDFNTLSGTVFDKYKPNAPKLSVENGTYFVTVGSIKAPVVATLAGQKPNAFVPAGSAQRYLVRIPVADGVGGYTASVYFAPFTFTPGVGYGASPAGWYDTATNAPKMTPGMGSAAIMAAGLSNHTSGCVGCHTSGPGAVTKNAAGDWQFKGFVDTIFAVDDPAVLDYNNDGNFEVMNIGCESCHGAGSNHILNGGDPTLIVNPAKLSATAQTDICGRCHATSKSVPTGTFGWPYNDATGTNWTPFDAKAGTSLSSFYTLTSTLWPDGIHVNGGRPFNAYKNSLHATFAPHMVGCPDCHDPHAEGEGHLLRETMVEANLTIPTNADDNTLCISCHATHGPFAGFTQQDVLDSTKGVTTALDKIAKTVEAHTHHPYAPERTMGLSRCTGCHMAAGHNFDAISADMTLKYATTGNGMINSCAAGCHNNRVDVWGYGIKGATGINPSITGTNVSTWTNPFDVTLATKLKAYFGDGGAWWNTHK
ncbi:MAG TPA: cytochrome c3 family protein [Thermoanaerobaculia bacterium]|nr:cytochrome c3 family protein [Thermoanaerobaculia bacterium]